MRSESLFETTFSDIREAIQSTHRSYVSFLLFLLIPVFSQRGRGGMTPRDLNSGEKIVESDVPNNSEVADILADPEYTPSLTSLPCSHIVARFSFAGPHM